MRRLWFNGTTPSGWAQPIFERLFALEVPEGAERRGGDLSIPPPAPRYP